MVVTAAMLLQCNIFKCCTSCSYYICWLSSKIPWNLYCTFLQHLSLLMYHWMYVLLCDGFFRCCTSYPFSFFLPF